MDKDMRHNMKYAGKMTAECDHFCSKRVCNAKFYHWFSYLDKEFIKTMCEKCALREMWGYNYKQQRGYKRWIG
tara:strand:- start:316 stop:534 length:219 start_codon:yes stop_codon:yes gene_type:complete